MQLQEPQVEPEEELEEEELELPDSGNVEPSASVVPASLRAPNEPSTGPREGDADVDGDRDVDAVAEAPSGTPSIARTVLGHRVRNSSG